MQILYMTHRLPYPPDKGERIRAFYQLRHLTARHEVDLFCFADSRAHAENQRFLQGMCRNVYAEILGTPVRIQHAIGNLVTGRPMSFGFFRSQQFHREIRRALNRCSYDVIFVSCSSMGQYIAWPAPAPVVIDFVDADSHKFRQYAAGSSLFRRWLYTREARTVAVAEQSLGRQAAASIAISGRDARELGGGGPTGFPIEILPNGVHVPNVADAEDQSEFREMKPFALFLGTMNYPPNSDAAVYFAREIFPLVRKTEPRLRFVIVGRDPDRRVRELAAIPGVLIKEAVPDAFRYFRNADVTVAPFRISQGFHNKIAESVAVGTPVVTTSRAMEGIGLSERDGLFVADSPDDFAQKVVLVLKDPGLRDRLRQKASSVQQRLSWDISLSKLEQLIVQVAVRNSRLSRELVVEH